MPTTRSSAQILDEAAKAINQGDLRRGKQLLLRVLDSEPDNTLALLWLTKCTQDPRSRASLFQQVLSIDPSNPHAIRGIRMYSKYLNRDHAQRQRHQKRRETFVRAIRYFLVFLILIALIPLFYLMQPQPVDPGEEAFSYAAGFAKRQMYADDPLNYWCGPDAEGEPAALWYKISVQSTGTDEYTVLGATRAIDAACVYEISYFSATVRYDRQTSRWNLVGNVYFSNNCVTIDHRCTGTFWTHSWRPDMNWTPP